MELSTNSYNDKTEFATIAKRVLKTEGNAIINLADSIDEEAFTKACKLILDCKGRVIITGMGKSGHIGQKLAASLTSTGIASHFLHPAEGFHGDLGVVHRKDLVLALSFSGETKEIIELLTPVRYIGVPVISITSHPNSSLAVQSDVSILLGQTKEADSHNLVPTTSTTVTLAVGDALIVALMEAREFTPEDFAVFHPKGMLGKKLTLQVKSLFEGNQNFNPVVKEEDTFVNALKVITSYTLGGTSVVDNTNKLVGIITDGDVRRIIERFANKGKSVAQILETPAKDLMTKNPTCVNEDILAHKALKIMENHKPRPIFILPVVNEFGEPAAMLHLHKLVQAGFKTNNN